MALKSRWLRTASNGKRLQIFDGVYTAIGAAGIDCSSVNSTALLHGAGTSTYPVTTSTADSRFLSYYGKTSATSGDARCAYFNLALAGTIAATGYGDAVRARAQVSGTGYSYATGLHATCEIAAGGTATGSSSGLRATYAAVTDTRTLGGAISAIHLSTDVGANNTMPTNNAFIRCTKDGSVDFDNFLQLPAIAVNGSIFAAHTTQTMTHSIRIIDSAGTEYYAMCCDAATNRS